MKTLLFDDNNIAAKISKLLILAIPFMCVGVCMDNDFWFTINHGRYILTYGFTDIEPFTVHEGLAFSFEKWLTCISFYKIYDWLGVWGMFWFMMLLFAVIIGLFYKGCVLFSGGNKNASLIITGFCMSFFGWSYVRTRPQLFSYIFMLLEVICLEKYARSGNVRKLWPLPLLSFLYMQFHSTMLPIFYILMLPYLCDFAGVRALGISGGRYRKLPILVFMVLSMLTPLINPYGVRSFVYLFNSLNDGGLLMTINEVKRSTAEDLAGCCAPVFVIQVLYIITRLRRKERFPLRYFFMLCGTFAMALYAVRNNAFFVLMGGLICAWEMKYFDLNYGFAPLLKKLAAVTAVIVALCICIVPYNIMRSTYAWQVIDDFVKLHPDTNVRMYTDFNCGSYAEWQGIRCYADPRAEVFLKSVNGKEDILAEIWDSMHSKIGVAELQEKYDFDFWLVQMNYSLDNQLKNSPKYNMLFENDDYRIYKFLESNK